MIPNRLQLHAHEAHRPGDEEQVRLGRRCRLSCSSSSSGYVVEELLQRDSVFGIVLSLMTAEAAKAAKSVETGEGRPLLEKLVESPAASTAAAAT